MKKFGKNEKISNKFSINCKKVLNIFRKYSFKKFYKLLKNSKNFSKEYWCVRVISEKLKIVGQFWVWLNLI